MTKQFPKLLLLIAALVVIGNAYSQTCPTGLVSYWKMDELSGLSLTDFKGGHTANCSQTLGRDYSGRVIYSQIFDTLKVGTVANHADYSFGAGSSFTVVYWVKFSETVYFGQDHVVISKGDYKGGLPTEGFFCSGNNGSGKINFLLSDGTYFSQLESTLGYNDGAWHQVALVRDEATNTNYLYVDGSPVDQETYNFSGGFANSYNLLFGTLLSNSNQSYYFKGSLDEVAIYNRALSSSEINTQRTAANTNGVGICDGLNPNIISIPGTKASVNGTYTYTLRTAGQQSGLTYTLLTKPTGMTIAGGVISWTPTSKTADGLVSVRANNGVAPADTQTFRIYVSDEVTCPTGLICLHKLNETAGPTYADHYGLHNATAPTSPTATTGKINGGQLFGSSSKIDIPDNASEFDWAVNGSFSIEYWMKTSTSGAMVCVSRNRTDYANVARWFVGTNDLGQATFELLDNSGNIANNVIVSGTSVVSNGNWHHIVAVRNGSNNTNKIYVDGVEEGTASKTYSNSFVADDPLEVTIGYMKRLASQNEYHYTGTLDEVAIFNRALSATDVATSYNAGSPAGYCAEGNAAPAFTSTAVLTATEDAAYSYSIAINDVDAGDVLTLTAPTIPTWLTLNWTAGQKTATLTGTPAGANVGNNNVVLRVTDTHTPIDQTFTINVANVNDAPVKTSTPTTTTNEGSLYTYILTVTDADAADVITIAVVTKPAWLTFTYTPGAKTATLSGTPDDANIGANAIDLTISDGTATIHETYTLTVSSVNDLPVITGQNALNVNEDQSILLVKSNLTISDPDNNATDLTLTVLAGTNFTFTGNTVTPASNYAGQLNVNVIVNDLAGASAEYPVVITVNAINDTPVITTTPIEAAQVGKLYVYVIDATDAENSDLTYSIISKPSWLTFDAGTKILSGIPSTAGTDATPVVLSVSDGDLSTEQTFFITVSTTAITEVKENEFVLYPIPVSNELNIRFKILTEETVIHIINASGMLIQSVNVPANTDITTIPMQNMEPGMYICHIKNSSINSTSRFLVVK